VITYTLTNGRYAHLISELLDTKPIHTGEWQAMDTSKSKAHATHELEDVTILIPDIPSSSTRLAEAIPFVDEEWAADHFTERVSGEPLNPAPSHVRWPYAVRGNGDHTTAGQFDHTYPERFWPRHAEHTHDTYDLKSGESDTPIATREAECYPGNYGIRFRYGDLDDVVDLLVRNPMTRQAYLPVWFPEDTGAHHGQRVPCTLGYHFMIREGRLSIRYFMRSCDIYRHLSNDLYLAGRLAQWMVEAVNARTNEAYGVDDPGGFTLGGLTMHITSLHAFVGDRKKMEARINELPSSVS
jgi:hypothetical protein